MLFQRVSLGPLGQCEGDFRECLSPLDSWKIVLDLNDAAPLNDFKNSWKCFYFYTDKWHLVEGRQGKFLICTPGSERLYSKTVVLQPHVSESPGGFDRLKIAGHLKLLIL